MISISRCSSDWRPNMHRWAMKPCNVSLSMIRRHPWWVRGGKKVDTKSTFLSRFELALGLEYLCFSRDSWVRSLQGQKGSEHLGFLVQTSKVEAKPGCISYHLVSLCLSFRGLDESLQCSWMGITSTLSHGSQQQFYKFTFQSLSLFF